MEALRIRKRLKSESLHLTGLNGMANKNVEIIILVEPEGEQPDKGSPSPHKRVPGTAKGLITVAEDFHEPLDDEAAREFYK